MKSILLISTLLLFIFLQEPQELQPSSQGPDIDLEALSERVHELVNEERERQKISPLKSDKRLVELARNHSADMAVRNYVDHYTPEGKSPTDRATNAGFSCTLQPFSGDFSLDLGENIFMAYLYTTYEAVVVNGEEKRSYNWKDFDTLAHEVVTSWMNSEAHKENILQQDYRFGGIGIATDTAYRYYVTQNFC